MDRHGVRYLFEHRLLPQFFFTETENFIGTLLSEKDVLYRIIDSLFRKEDLENPYTAGQFSAEAAKITEQILMIKITFPEPEEAPLCYRTYLFFDTDFGKLGCYSVEKNSRSSAPGRGTDSTATTGTAPLRTTRISAAAWRSI